MYVLQIQGIHHGLEQFASEVDHMVGIFWDFLTAIKSKEERIRVN